MSSRQSSTAKTRLSFRRIPSIRHADAGALQRRGLALGRRGRLAEAASCCQKALQLRPHFPAAHFCLGRVFARKHRWSQAVDCFETALRQRPKLPAVLNRLGLALAELDRWEEAIACYRKLLVQQPDHFLAHRILCKAYSHLGRLDDSLRHIEHALRLKPGHPESRVNRALLWLRQGEFARGWAEYEWRWQLTGNPPRRLPQPLWDGAPLAGRTILLHAEQGLGDTLHFLRYAAGLKESGARVILESPPALSRLLARCPGIDCLVTRGSTLPPFDVHAPLLSLPRLVGTILANIPARVPYLAAEPKLVESWRRKLAAYPGFKVGIVWQGSSRFPDDRLRSIPLSHFESLAGVKGVRLFSLQKNEGTEQLAGRANRFPVIDLGPKVDEAAGPFMDTAAIMPNLDLVITCDTAIAHLAGALGVPVWLPLSVSSDWRWRLNQEDSPWYPSMRLFRQKEHGNWREVFLRLTAALKLECRRPVRLRPITIEVSPGELLDKISILEIKRRRICDPEKRRNVRFELASLQSARRALAFTPEVARLARELGVVNEALWKIEDEIRRCEQKGDFGADFIRLARSVYLNNDRRARLKRQINESLGSPLVEEKSLPDTAARRSARPTSKHVRRTRET